MSRIRAVFRRRAPEHSGEALRIRPTGGRSARATSSGERQPDQDGLAEFKLLKFLIGHPDRVFSRTQLLDSVWGDHVFIEERTVDVHVLRLAQGARAGQCATSDSNRARSRLSAVDATGHPQTLMLDRSRSDWPRFAPALLHRALAGLAVLATVVGLAFSHASGSVGGLWSAGGAAVDPPCYAACLLRGSNSRDSKTFPTAGGSGPMCLRGCIARTARPSRTSTACWKTRSASDARSAHFRKASC